MESKKIVIKDGAKKPGKVKTFFYNLFVKNIGYKAIALGIAIVLWLLVVGFGI
jgi:hypothetical protein